MSTTSKNVIDAEVTISDVIIKADSTISNVIVEADVTPATEIVHTYLPDYEGPYEIIPTSETQILETAGKTMTDNIVVNPIPSNYGLITWNGSTLTVS